MDEDQKHKQLLTALDKIAGRLISIERERDALRVELDEVRNEQSEFEDLLLEKTNTSIRTYKQEQSDFRKLLAKQAKEQSEIKQKVIESSKHRDLITNLTADNLKKALDESLKIQRQMRQDLEMNSVRQARLEEELIQSNHRQTTLLRKVENMASKYQRLSRKVERVENLSMDAIQALQGKAQGLIADEGGKEKEDIRYEAVESGFPKASKDKAVEQDNQSDGSFFGKISQRTGIAAAVVFFALAGITFGLYNNTTDNVTGAQDSALVVKALERPDSYTDVPEEVVFSEPSETEFFEDDVEYFTEAEEEKTAFEDMAETLSSDGVEEKTEVTEVKETTSDIKAFTRDEALPKVFQQLEKQAFSGKGEAQHDLAALYSAGENGVKQDFERAAYWFEQAGESGIANARYNLGVLYHQGLGVDKNINKAVEWYSRAAELGHPEAQYNLGIANIEGVGTDYNPKLAVSYFRKAAEGDVAEAAYNLGLILENGLLGQENTEEAVYWYSRAASMGNQGAKSALSLIKKTARLSDERVSEIIASFEKGTDGQNIAAIEAAAGISARDIEETPMTATTAPVRETQEPKQDSMSAWQRLVSNIQGQLKYQDFYLGPADGIYGPRTRDAIKAYEVAYDLPVTGEPSRELLGHMEERSTPIEQGSSN